ncbi:MAG TPA: cupredoxin domain-containing protein [Candidatus Eisenbacteria bacterium]|nr:cupredoxin domain-containing protein [Candidatus Eisenbacteria bacterium]
MVRTLNVREARIAAILLAVTIALAGGCSSKKEPKTVKAPPGNKDVPIQVTEHGFEPARIEVTKGTNATLVFTRVTDRTCAKDIVIGGNGAHLDLPLNQPVRIGLGTVNTNIPFACGMKMVTGEVVAVAQ